MGCQKIKEEKVVLDGGRKIRASLCATLASADCPTPNMPILGQHVAGLWLEAQYHVLIVVVQVLFIAAQSCSSSQAKSTYRKSVTG